MLVKKQITPQSFRNKYTPTDTLILAQGHLSWTSDIQNDKFVVLNHLTYDNVLQQQ